jgi:hypothetical protein
MFYHEMGHGIEKISRIFATLVWMLVHLCVCPHAGSHKGMHTYKYMFVTCHVRMHRHRHALAPFSSNYLVDIDIKNTTLNLHVTCIYT